MPPFRAPWVRLRPVGPARRARLALATLTLTLFAAPLAPAAAPAPAKFQKVLFASATTDHAEFDAFVARAQTLGATHVDVSVELPRSTWQYDTPGDPYPAWAVLFPSLWKVAPSALVRPHVDAAYADRVLDEIAARCAIVRRHGLKAYFSGGEAHMMPEALYRTHPAWRGPRVDHPVRSRVPRFAPDLDHPAVLAQYRESAALLLRRCPEIELLLLWTNDSGCGLPWSSALYSGRSGAMASREKPMADRLNAFFAALRDGAASVGGQLEISFWDAREPAPRELAANLPAGTAVDNAEGGTGRDYKAPGGYYLWWWWDNFAYPVIGVPQPVEFVKRLEEAARSDAPRLVLGLDPFNRELSARIYERFWRGPSTDVVSRYALLRDVAAAEVGDARADALVDAWMALDHAAELDTLLGSGGQVLALGAVHQRWLTRPLVPFPGELTEQERAYFRPFQFQARTEEDAQDLVNMQGRRLIDGWTSRHTVLTILGRILRDVQTARQHVSGFAPQLDAPQRGRYELLAARLRALELVVANARHVVDYQAQLDRVRRLNLAPDPLPLGGTDSSWDRQLMLHTARAELDNTVALLDLLETAPGPLLHLAPTAEEEEITWLSPALPAQLRRKLDLMNARWGDYARIFTDPVTPYHGHK